MGGEVRSGAYHQSSTALLLRTTSACLCELTSLHKAIRQIAELLPASALVALPSSPLADLEHVGNDDCEELEQTCVVEDADLRRHFVDAIGKGQFGMELGSLVKIVGNASRLFEIVTSEIRQGSLRGVALRRKLDGDLESVHQLEEVDVAVGNEIRAWEAGAVTDGDEVVVVTLFPAFRRLSKPLVQALLLRCRHERLLPPLEFLREALSAMVLNWDMASDELRLLTLLANTLAIDDTGRICVGEDTARDDGTKLVDVNSPGDIDQALRFLAPHLHSVRTACDLGERETHDGQNQQWCPGLLLGLLTVLRAPASAASVRGKPVSSVAGALGLSDELCMASSISGGALFRALETAELQHQQLPQGNAPRGDAIDAAEADTFLEPVVSTAFAESAPPMTAAPPAVPQTAPTSAALSDRSVAAATKAASLLSPGAVPPETATIATVSSTEIAAAMARPRAPALPGMQQPRAFSVCADAGEANYEDDEDEDEEIRGNRRHAKKLFVECFKEDLVDGRQLLMSQINNLYKMRTAGKGLDYKGLGYEKLHDFLLDIPGLSVHGSGNRMEVRIRESDMALFEAFCEDISEEFDSDLPRFQKPQPVPESFQWRVIEIFRRSGSREIPAKYFRDLWHMFYPSEKLQCKDFGYRDVRGLLANIPMVEKVGGKYNTKYALKSDFDLESHPAEPPELPTHPFHIPPNDVPTIPLSKGGGRGGGPAAQGKPSPYVPTQPPPAAPTPLAVGPLSTSQPGSGVPTMRVGGAVFDRSPQFVDIAPGAVVDRKPQFVGGTRGLPDSMYSSAPRMSPPRAASPRGSYDHMGENPWGRQELYQREWHPESLPRQTQQLYRNEETQHIPRQHIQVEQAQAATRQQPMQAEQSPQHQHQQQHLQQHGNSRVSGPPRRPMREPTAEGADGAHASSAHVPRRPPGVHLKVDRPPLTQTPGVGLLEPKQSPLLMHVQPPVDGFSNSQLSQQPDRAMSSFSSATSNNTSTNSTAIGSSMFPPSSINATSSSGASGVVRGDAESRLAQMIGSRGPATNESAVIPEEPSRPATRGLSAAEEHEDEQEEVADIPSPPGLDVPSIFDEAPFEPLADAAAHRRMRKLQKKNPTKGATFFLSSPGALSTSDRDASRHQGKFDMTALYQTQLKNDRCCMIVDFSTARIQCSNGLCDALFDGLGPLAQREVTDLIHNEDRMSFSANMLYLSLGKYSLMEPQTIRIKNSRGVQQVQVSGEQLEYSLQFPGESPWRMSSDVGCWWTLYFIVPDSTSTSDPVVPVSIGRDGSDSGAAGSSASFNDTLTDRSRTEPVFL